MEKYKLIVLIPAYQPDEKLIKLVNKLNKENLDIIVIDDGSDREYQKIFSDIENNSIVLHHKVNKGKGRAIKTGLQFIQKKYKKDYIVITMDCDGQHTIEDAKKLFKYNKNHPNELVLGSRKFDKNVPLRSILGNTITRIVYGIVTKTKVYDTQTGLRAFSDQLIEKMISIEGERFEYEINVLLELAKMKVPIKEITIKTIYIDNNSKSHFNTIKDSIKIYKEIIKFSMSSFSSFLLDIILFSVFSHFSAPLKNSLQLSNITARLLSATFNFFINRKYVFKQKSNLIKSIIGYISLAVLILTINTILLSLLVNYLSINKICAKLIVESTLFVISYIIQRTIVFK